MDTISIIVISTFALLFLAVVAFLIWVAVTPAGYDGAELGASANTAAQKWFEVAATVLIILGLIAFGAWGFLTTWWILPTLTAVFIAGGIASIVKGVKASA